MATPHKPPAGSSTTGRPFVLERTEEEHKEIIRKIEKSVHERAEVYTQNLNTSVDKMLKEFRDSEILNNEVPEKMIKSLEKCIADAEAKRLAVSILPSEVKKLAINSQKSKSNEMERIFFRRLYDDIFGEKIQPAKVSNPPKKKGALSKLKKFFGLSTEKMSKEMVSKETLDSFFRENFASESKEKVSRESFTPNSELNETRIGKKAKAEMRKTSREVAKTLSEVTSLLPAGTPVGQSPAVSTNPKSLTKEKLIQLAVSREQLEDGNIKKPPTTPKPWYKFW